MLVSWLVFVSVLGCANKQPPSPLPVTTPVTAAPLPASGKALSRIALGSCNGQGDDQGHWDAIAKASPDLFLFIGDNVYGDRVDGEVIADPAPTLDKLQVAYGQLAAQPQWQAFYQAVPTLVTWDDHDYGLNDQGGTFPHRARAEEIFLDFWKVPGDDPRRGRDGVYDAVVFGPEGQRVQIILLDTRSFRSDIEPAAGGRGYVPSADAAKTMLGAEQWAWLEAALRTPAELRLVVSTVQVVSTHHVWERWDTLPHERQRLLDLIAATPGALLLSGDRHIGAFYTAQVGEEVVYELTSSSLNLDFVEQVEDDPDRLGAATLGRNFGLIEIDWAAGSVSLGLHDETGAPLPQQQVLSIGAL